MMDANLLFPVLPAQAAAPAVNPATPATAAAPAAKPQTVPATEGVAQTGVAPGGAEVGDAAAITGAASGWFVVAAVLFTLVMPFVLGWLFAKLLRLPNLATRIGVVLLALFIGAAPFTWNVLVGASQGYSVGESLKRSIRLGIDLAGGTNLVYRVQETADKKLNDRILDQMVGSVVQRINPSGTEEVTVRQVGRDRIEVIVPGADREKTEQIKSRLTKLGSLEFGILANTTDHQGIIAAAQKLPGSQRNVYQGGRIVASWKSVAREKPGVIGDTKVGDWKEGAEGGDERIPGMARYVNRRGELVEPPIDGAADLQIDRQILTIVEPLNRRVTGEYLTSTSSITSQETGRPAVSFSFNAAGGRRMSALTSANRPGRDGRKRRLAILLDDQIHSAPTLNDVISTQGQITGSFSQDEVTELVNVLDAGALEVPIDPTPISEFTVSPLLGSDTVKKSISAILWSGLLVFVFMAAYYWKAGLIADLCLALNIILVLGTMSFIDATFTLPGLAGIVLTIGMAVDANVLIFERIREEKARGSSLRVGIQNGFDRALSTIIDANVTTLIVAVILFMIGTDAVRGFAVTLFVGIAMSMFTALYVGRLLFEILERKGMRKLEMVSVLGRSNVDFMGKAIPAMIASGVLIVAGLAVLFYRGSAMFDIDFLGGTMVTFQLKEGQTATATQIRDALNDVPEFKGDISVERLVLSGEGAGEAGRRFRVRTTRRDSEQVATTGQPANIKAATPEKTGKTVSELVAEAFDDNPKFDILRVLAQVGPVTPIAADAAGVAQSAYVGGHQATVSLSQELNADTVAAYLSRQLSQGVGGGRKYENPAGLLRVLGTAGTGMQAAENEARTFNKVRVEAAPAIVEADFAAALNGMQTTMSRSPVFDEVNSFDSSVAGETQNLAIMAILASWLAIIGYLWFRFQSIAFGLAAVAALVHDVLITLGAIALAAAAGAAGFHFLGLEEFKINLPMVAAILTLIGYSINDTIVVFDRIREVRGKNPRLNETIINTSLNQTLSRTLLTALTTFIVVAILYFFGGEGIHGFAFVLVVGIIVGTYSSIFIASPILLWLVNRKATRTPITSPARQPLAR